MTLSREELSRLAVAQAVYKAMGEQLSTRGGAHGADNVRTRADAELRSMFEESGTDRVSLMVNGSKVGTLSARLTKPTSRDWFACDNVAELVAWLRGGRRRGGAHAARGVAGRRHRRRQRGPRGRAAARVQPAPRRAAGRRLGRNDAARGRGQGA